MTGYYSIPVANYLREARGGVRRSAYEADINPWSRRGEVEAALLFRGAIVSAYGYIETQLGDLAIRISRMPEYSDLRDHFPFKLRQRVSYLRRAFDRPPLAAFRETAERALRRFDDASELRHQVAHARMQVMPDWGVTFEDYRRGDDGQLELRRGRYLLADLEREAWKAASRSRLCQHLVNELNQTGLVPAIE